MWNIRNVFIEVIDPADTSSPGKKPLPSSGKEYVIFPYCSVL